MRVSGLSKDNPVAVKGVLLRSILAATGYSPRYRPMLRTEMRLSG